MAHFYSISKHQILFHQHYLDEEGNKKERSFLLSSDGDLSSLDWDKSINIKDVPLKRIKKLNRGELYNVYEGLGKYIVSKMPTVPTPLNPDFYIEAHVFSNETSMYTDFKTGEPLPLIRGYSDDLFLNGVSMKELLSSGEIKDRPFGASFLEAYFDFEIPEGFEALALSELDDLCEEDEFEEKKEERGSHKWVAHNADTITEEDYDSFVKMISQGRVIPFEDKMTSFVEWLIQGEDLPENDWEFFTELKQYASFYVSRMKGYQTRMSLEAAITLGSSYLWKIGKAKEVFAYLKPFVDKRKSPLACYQLALWYKEYGFEGSAHKYALTGSSLGNGDCSYLAASMAEENGRLGYARFFLEQGIEVGHADCFYLKASFIMKYMDKEEKHPFSCDNPIKEAVSLLEEGVKRHSSKAMVLLGSIYLDHYDDLYSERALQLLFRAKERGRADSYYYLAKFFKNKHKDKTEQNLEIANDLIDTAIKRKGFDIDECKLLKADILLDMANPEEAVSILEELAYKGNEKAQVALGKLLSGIDPRYPYVEDPVPEFLLKYLVDPNTFFKAVLWRNYFDLMPIEKAIPTLEKLGDAGNPLAYRELAKIYRDGPENIRDEEMADEFETRFATFKID